MNDSGVGFDLWQKQKFWRLSGVKTGCNAHRGFCLTF
jgi:hypothetical protein